MPAKSIFSTVMRSMIASSVFSHPPMGVGVGGTLKDSTGVEQGKGKWDAVHFIWKILLRIHS